MYADDPGRAGRVHEVPRAIIEAAQAHGAQAAEAMVTRYAAARGDDAFELLPVLRLALQANEERALYVYCAPEPAQRRAW